MNPKKLLRLIGKDAPACVKITEDQGAGDIMRRMAQKHKSCADDYDKIADEFSGGNLNDICYRLWTFCKNYIDYDEETIDAQYISAPQTILMRGACDCKGYALFIGGVLDALKRQGYDIDWFYRFAAYDNLETILGIKSRENVPGHVFVVVRNNGREIFVDPVLRKYNDHKPYYYHVDKVVKTAAAAIAGCGCNKGAIGSAATTGAIIQKISPALATIPVVGWIAAAVGEVAGFFLIAFGSKYKDSTAVRWLTAIYEYYVLGLDTQSDNKVNANNVAPAQAWFGYVLGVPVYDKYRLHDLLGTDPDNNADLNWSLLRRASEYLKWPEVQKAGITMQQALEAAQLASVLKENGVKGGWAGAVAAPALVDNDGISSAKVSQGQMVVDNQGNLLTPTTATTSNGNYILIAAAIAAAFVLLSK